MQVAASSLWATLRRADRLSGRFLHSKSTSVALLDLIHGTVLDKSQDELAGKSVLILTNEQLAAALALIELDGVVRRMVLCPADFQDSQIATVCAKAEIDAVVTDCDPSSFSPAAPVPIITIDDRIKPCLAARDAICRTEWVLFTSGTTGAPKLVAHDFGGLTAAITQTPSLHEPHVWATFYDIRRYGGLQIFLRAVLGNASLVLSSAGEPLGAHLDRLEQHGVTHISGTPSHWRRVLMHSAAKSFTPKVIRLSGEVADQAVLDGLKAMFPAAKIGHAYASTEAGVAFEVNDGLEGLPAGLIGAQIGDIEMKVMGGNLQIRSRRTALGYIGENDRALLQDDGFVDTGDVVERRGERYYFAGRKDGIINVGGNKVHPEEVEAVINRHPSVQMSLVRSQRNRITGGLVVADVVLKFDDPGAIAPERSVQQEILTFCSTQLPRHKVPALVRIVSSLDLTAGGKLERRNA